MHCVSQKCVHFGLCYKYLIFYIPSAKPALSPCRVRQALIHWEELRQLQLSYLQRLLHKNLQVSFSPPCRGHIKQSLGKILKQSWPKGWNREAHLLQVDIPSAGLKSYLFSRFFPPQPREPLELPTELNVSEATKSLCCPRLLVGTENSAHQKPAFEFPWAEGRPESRLWLVTPVCMRLFFAKYEKWGRKRDTSLVPRLLHAEPVLLHGLYNRAWHRFGISH